MKGFHYKCSMVKGINKNMYDRSTILKTTAYINDEIIDKQSSNN